MRAESGCPKIMVTLTLMKLRLKGIYREQTSELRGAKGDIERSLASSCLLMSKAL